MKRTIYFLLGAGLLVALAGVLFISEYYYGDISYLLGYGTSQEQVQEPTQDRVQKPVKTKTSNNNSYSIQRFVDESQPLKDIEAKYGERYTITGPIEDVRSSSLFLKDPRNSNSRSFPPSNEYHLKFQFKGNPKLMSKYEDGQQITIVGTLTKLENERQHYTFTFSDPKVLSPSVQ